MSALPYAGPMPRTAIPPGDRDGDPGPARRDGAAFGGRRADEAGRGLQVCVVYATYGRPEILSATFDAVLKQTLPPALVVVSCTRAADAGTLAERQDVRLVIGPKGSSRQRNRALDAVPDAIDVVACFDDDFVPHPRWLQEVVEIFGARPEVGAVTGTLLADGIKGPGLSVEEAFARIAAAPADISPAIEDPYSPYGCNMAFRRSMIAGMHFDERLVLYGWLEDRDFGARIRQRGGRTVKAGAARGVHMGVKRGRQAGLQLGYSQVVNPVYMNRKGTMRAPLVARHIVGNVASNLVKAARPEPYIDRPGRLRGNLIGLLDVLRGRLTPERAASL